jgi:hypothetical protein
MMLDAVVDFDRKLADSKIAYRNSRYLFDGNNFYRVGNVYKIRKISVESS